MNVYSIYDSKAEAYLQPFFSPTNATALRSFSQAANDTETNFNKFAADYTLFQIAAWDEHSGKLTPLKANIALGCALEYINAPAPLRAVEEA